jgi:hypothetical protein
MRTLNKKRPATVFSFAREPAGDHERPRPAGKEARRGVASVAFKRVKASPSRRGSVAPRGLLRRQDRKGEQG